MPRLTEASTTKSTKPAGSAKAPKAPKLIKAATARKATAKTADKITGIKTRKTAATRTQEREMSVVAVNHWTPDMIQDAIEAVQVDAPDTLLAFGSQAGEGAGEEKRNPLLTQGPDAAQRETFNDDPRMIEAREWLNDLIDNPPRYADGSIGSIRVYVDRYKMAAALERNIGHNRKRKPRFINYMVKVIKDGLWIENGQTMAFDYNGEFINGQNRAEAIVIANPVEPLPVDIRFGLSPEAFKHMDNGSPRTNADVFQIGGKKNVSALSAACRMMYRYEQVPSMRDIDGITPEDQDEVLARHPKMEEGASMQWRFRNGGLNSAAASAVFWALANEFNPTVAAEFLHRFEKGIAQTETDAILKARLYFQKNPRTKPEERLSIIIKAFNAFVANKPVKAYRAWGRGDAFPQMPRKGARVSDIGDNDN